jgi:hypothetical protein
MRCETLFLILRGGNIVRVTEKQGAEKNYLGPMKDK